MISVNRHLGPMLFPSVLWRTQADGIHLTFDDGPHVSATLDVLEMLDKHHAHATFFFLGEHAQRLPEIAQQAGDAGHLVGNHAIAHQSLFLRRQSFQREQISGGRKILEDVLGTRSRIFRPPFGHFDCTTLRLCSSENLKLVLWDVDPRDYADRHPLGIIRRVLSSVTNGSIVLLHDSALTAGKVKLYLEPLLQQLGDRGFKFSTLPL